MSNATIQSLQRAKTSLAKTREKQNALKMEAAALRETLRSDTRTVVSGLLNSFLQALRDDKTFRHKYINNLNAYHAFTNCIRRATGHSRWHTHPAVPLALREARVEFVRAWRTMNTEFVNALENSQDFRDMIVKKSSVKTPE
jgi:hypothetical protein